MKRIIIFLLCFLVVTSCSSSKKRKDKIENPSSLKKQSVLTKEYPGVFSANDSYIHLPIEEKEKDQIIYPCSSGKATETINKLLSEMKDTARIYINSYYVATCYVMNNDFNRGLHYFSKVYSSSQDLSLKSKALANMGIIQWNWGKYRKALAYLRESYNLQNNPITLYHLTSLELELGLTQKINSHRLEMLKFNFTDNWWKFLLAESSFFSGDYEKSVMMYETLPDQFWNSQQSSLVHYLVAMNKTGRHELAKTFFLKWKAIIIENPSYLTAKNILPEIIKYE